MIYDGTVGVIVQILLSFKVKFPIRDNKVSSSSSLFRPVLSLNILTSHSPSNQPTKTKAKKCVANISEVTFRNLPNDLVICLAAVTYVPL